MSAPETALIQFPFRIDLPPRTFVSDAAETLREEVDRRLLTHGAVLLQGAARDSAADLGDLAKALSGAELFGYAGGASPRRGSGVEGVYNSTEYPAEMGLLLHNELSYSAVYPERLYFMCEVEPEAGGETTLGDSRRILRAMPAEIVDELKTRGICYIRNLTAEPGGGYSWPEAFETGDRDEVETICCKSGAAFRWEDDGTLRLSQTGPATVFHPITGEEVWFNQAAGFYAGPAETSDPTRPRLECTFGDGGAIPAETIERIRTVLEQNAVTHRWQRSDIIILDNILAAHGRMPFSGPRRIVLAMT